METGGKNMESIRLGVKIIGTIKKTKQKTQHRESDYILYDIK